MKNNQCLGPLIGTISVPGDKSITHRAVMMTSLATGQAKITKPLLGEDCMRTIEIFKQLGVQIEIDTNGDVQVDSKGYQNFIEPHQTLYTGNSGTTTRLLAGLLSGLPMLTVLSGDASIGKRPMDRVITPLKQMNANIIGSNGNKNTPLIMQPSQISGTDYQMTVASAQVKSALMFAGLFANDEVKITELEQTRNHTEIMFKQFGIPVDVDGLTISMPKSSVNLIQQTNIDVPGDISSAAFFIVAALITPGSDITIKNVGINLTRAGIIEVCQKMNANIELLNIQDEHEKIADIRVRYTENMKATTIEGALIPKLIDEIPILALLLAYAKGTSVIKDAEELKVKETNRIDATVDTLNLLGYHMEKTDDGMIIYGLEKQIKHANTFDTYHDHRIGMMLYVASLFETDMNIENDEVIDISYPNFIEDFKSLIQGEI
ncbi:3-phosphoshikimate 1-carboxyvinyltransferase [Macrococcus sp. DPC7161]|uniref:3-phosphoshikimate 1-carboxyvinyltransferase n=1 Tax=Macrococcus sp. DPC7161 TaxID=2507060 RepID=UPI00100AEFDC|nr:3-phosphoshikimate 1-carboxyvinyltransferase [Macrococcus sp. DPC7161]RXK19276.1 3-phosphoshikimate 1-carboxyvinyltransferase [Macrococcus sp. DPC7161]